MEHLTTKEFEITERLISIIKNTAAKAQLNESWVFADLIETTLKRDDLGCMFCMERDTTSSKTSFGVCISNELYGKIKHVARLVHLNKDDGELDCDEAVARLLILAITDRNSDFKETFDPCEVDRLYLANECLGLKDKRP